ncbi:hypothetical protein RND81_03G019200 [Saponaria officinalis]|uniref:Uncharacterized protein n=1 Tax=Saponaria officinalis TaxID=3572 RepID=A0AAW1M2Y8_SAPOF
MFFYLFFLYLFDLCLFDSRSTVQDLGFIVYVDLGFRVYVGFRFTTWVRLRWELLHYKKLQFYRDAVFFGVYIALSSLCYIASM